MLQPVFVIIFVQELYQFRLCFMGGMGATQIYINVDNIVLPYQTASTEELKYSHFQIIISFYLSITNPIIGLDNTSITGFAAAYTPMAENVA